MTEDANRLTERDNIPAAGPAVLGSWLRAILRALDARGVDGRALAARSGLDLQAIVTPEGRYPVAAGTRLWRLAVETTGDPCLGLFVSRFVGYTTFHALGAAMLASTTLSEAFERLVRYSRLVSDAATFRLDERQDGYRLVLEVPIGQARPADEAIDAFLALQLRTARALQENRSLRPIHVALERPEPSPSTPFHDFFRAPIAFSATSNELEFSRFDLEVPLPAGNADLARRLDEVLGRYLTRLDSAQLGSRVRAVLVGQLSQGEPGEDTVARALGMSTRTLQRRLAEQGTSFHTILDETRRELGCAYLVEGWSVTDSAFALGFSDISSFSRAFRRWTGVPPTEFAGSAHSPPAVMRRENVNAETQRHRDGSRNRRLRPRRKPGS